MKQTILQTSIVIAALTIGLAVGKPMGANEIYSTMFNGKVHCSRTANEITASDLMVSNSSALPPAPQVVR